MDVSGSLGLQLFFEFEEPTSVEKGGSRSGSRPMGLKLSSDVLPSSSLGIRSVLLLSRARDLSGADGLGLIHPRPSSRTTEAAEDLSHSTRRTLPRADLSPSGASLFVYLLSCGTCEFCKRKLSSFCDRTNNSKSVFAFNLAWPRRVAESELLTHSRPLRFPFLPPTA